MYGLCIRKLQPCLYASNMIHNLCIPLCLFGSQLKYYWQCHGLNLNIWIGQPKYIEHSTNLNALCLKYTWDVLNISITRILKSCNKINKFTAAKIFKQKLVWFTLQYLHPKTSLPRYTSQRPVTRVDLHFDPLLVHQWHCKCKRYPPKQAPENRSGMIWASFTAWWFNDESVNPAKQNNLKMGKVFPVFLDMDF